LARSKGITKTRRCVNPISQHYMSRTTEIKPSELARLIFQELKRAQPHEPHPDRTPESVLDGIFPDRHSQLQPPEREDFEAAYQEAWYTLVRRGLIMPSWNRPTGKDFTLTSIGKSSMIEDDILILVDDAQEIVNELKEKISNLDSVIEQYLLESLRACQEGLYISSVICLGAASERAIHCLAEAVINYDSNYQTDIESKTSISALTRYLSDNINRIFTMADGAFRVFLHNPSKRYIPEVMGLPG